MLLFCSRGCWLAARYYQHNVHVSFNFLFLPLLPPCARHEKNKQFDCHNAFFSPSWKKDVTLLSWLPHQPVVDNTGGQTDLLDEHMHLIAYMFLSSKTILICVLCFFLKSPCIYTTVCFKWHFKQQLQSLILIYWQPYSLKSDNKYEITNRTVQIKEYIKFGHYANWLSIFFKVWSICGVFSATFLSVSTLRYFLSIQWSYYVWWKSLINISDAIIILELTV